MEAFISARARLAGIVDGNEAWLLSQRWGFERREVRINELRRLFSIYSDTIFLSDVSEERVVHVAKLEAARDECLALALVVLNPAEDEEFRLGAAKCLDGLLQDPIYEEYLVNLLSSRPLPEVGYRGPTMSLQVSAPRTFALVGKLIGCQETVREMYSLLDSSLSMHGVKEQDRARIEGVFAKNGVFARLCDGSLSRADMDRLRFSCLQELDGAQSSRQIINLLFRRFGIRDPDREAIQLGEMRDVHQRNGVGASRPAGPVHELFRGIQAQINKITELLDEGKIELARRFADELVDEQVSRDEGAYASMSLCNLSERAKERGNFSLQLVWAKQATEVAPEDSRAYGHLGEAYLKLGRLEEAKSAFGKAANGGDRIFGAVGIARVLREAYQYEGALALLEELILNDTVDWTVLRLKAQILRDIGRYDDALAIYEKLADQVPQESWPLCGYAAIQADVGRFDDAMSTYSRAIELYPEDHVPPSGLGFVLVRQGEFSEGLRWLDASLERNTSGDIVPHLSKITALRWRGRYDKAINLSREMIRAQPTEIAWPLALVHCYIDQGLFHAAAEEIGRIRESIDIKNARVDRYEALIMRRCGRLVDALSLLDKLKSEYPAWLDALVDRGNVLKQMGHYELAQRQFQEVIARSPAHRGARNSAAILAALESRHVTVESDPLDNLVAPQDWRNLHAAALALLGHDKLKEAKALLVSGAKRCKFENIRAEFMVPLALARTMLGQYATAAQTVQQPRDDVGILQHAIIMGELGDHRAVTRALERVDNRRIDTRNVIDIVTRRYVMVDRDGVPSINAVVSEQRDLVLRAA